MTHVRQDALEALIEAHRTVPVLGFVREMSGVPIPLDHADRNCQIAFDQEDCKPTTPPGDPMLLSLERTAIFVSVITMGVPKNMTMAELARDVVAPVERSVARSLPLRDLVDTWFLSGTAYEYENQNTFPVVRVQLTWTMIYQTMASEPGVPITTNA